MKARTECDACDAPEISAKTPSPDPRLPRARTDKAAWTYAAGLLGRLQDVPRPNFPPARSEIAADVADLAAAPYALADWRARAVPIAAALGRDAVASLFGLMAQPPPCPASIPVWEWVFRVQIAAALVVSVLDRGWERSARKRALEALLFGPVDWSCTAAMIALTELARAEPEHESAVLELLLPELDLPINPILWSCIIEPALNLFDRLPIDDATRLRLGKMRRDSVRAAE